jgi:hypothetical protein
VSNSYSRSKRLIEVQFECQPKDSMTALTSLPLFSLYLSSDRVLDSGQRSRLVQCRMAQALDFLTATKVLCNVMPHSHQTQHPSVAAKRCVKIVNWQAMMRLALFPQRHAVGVFRPYGWHTMYLNFRVVAQSRTQQMCLRPNLSVAVVLRIDRTVNLGMVYTERRQGTFRRSQIWP